MTWYGDELIDNSYWVLDKLKAALAGLGGAAAAVKGATDTAAATAAAAQAAAAQAATASAAAQAVLDSAMALAGADAAWSAGGATLAGAAEAAATATATAETAVASGATVASLAGIGAALVKLAAMIGALIAGMVLAQGVGWAVDWLVGERIGKLWDWLTSGDTDQEVGSRQHIQEATDRALAAIYSSAEPDLRIAAKRNAQYLPGWEEFRMAYRYDPDARTAYEFAAASMQMLVHVSQAMVFAVRPDARLHFLCESILPANAANLARLSTRVHGILKDAPFGLLGLRLIPGVAENFAAKARRDGTDALPIEERIVLEEAMRAAGLRSFKPVEPDLLQTMLNRGRVLASTGGMSLGDHLLTQSKLWQGLVIYPWETTLLTAVANVTHTVKGG